MIADLAEYYHIYNYLDHPLLRVAIFVDQLRESSRVKKKINGMKLDLNTMLLASIKDGIETVIYMFNTDKNKKKPKFILEMLMKEGKKEEQSIYSSGEEFEKARSSILEKIKKGK